MLRRLPPSESPANPRRQAKTLLGARTPKSQPIYIGRKGWVARALSATLAIMAAAPIGCEPAGNTSPQLMEKPMTPAVAARVVREGPKTCITGLEKIEWGNASLYQNSMIAALTFAQQAGGDEADYIDLMGKSGLAFRLQVHQPDGCPSSPHACCGFDCWKQALWASGRQAETFDTGKGEPAAIEKARAAIVASIDRGRPVIYASEEAGLVVGYVNGGRQLLVRPYSPKAEGYVTTQKWPWEIIVLSPRKAAPPRKDVSVNSLRLAVHLWRTPEFEMYASGHAAYEAWASQLDDDKRFQSADPNVRQGVCLANGFTYGSLEHARQFAVKYLRSIQADFSPQAAGHIRKAADLYDQSHETIARSRPDIKCPWSLFPWDLKGGAEWTHGMRHTQAAVLREMDAFDKQAVAEIEQALQAEGLTRIFHAVWRVLYSAMALPVGIYGVACFVEPTRKAIDNDRV